MPLRFDVEEYLGTNADHSCSDEYCYYCLKDGNYTVDISMNEMVDIWVKYTDKYNWYSGTDYTPQELKTLLNKRLSTLKRWRQKEMTQHVHYEAVESGGRLILIKISFMSLIPNSWLKWFTFHSSISERFSEMLPVRISVHIFNVYGWNILPICLSLPDRVLKR